MASTWVPYREGYARNKDFFNFGKWGCKVSNFGDKAKDNAYYGGQQSVPSSKLPKSGTFSVACSIYIDSYMSGNIYNKYVTILYTDKTQQINSSILSQSQIESNLKKWKRYSSDFTTDPNKEIQSIVVWFFICPSNNKKFEGTIYFDDLNLALAQTRPYACIPKADTPPAIDGMLNDECWKRAAILSEFTLVGKNATTVNKTKAYLLYDKEYIYIGTVAYEKILDPELQQMYSFKNTVDERDSNGIFADDCIEIFISPDGRSYFHFAYNAKGALYDAHGTNKKWDGNAKVITAIGKDAWYAEIKIPRSSIKIEQPDFKLNVCREEKTNMENSSWSPVLKDFHVIDNWGLVSLYPRPVIQVYPERLDDFLTGNNRYLILNIRNASNSDFETLVEADVKCADAQGGECCFRQLKSVIPENSKKSETIQMELPDGKYNLRYSVFDVKSKQLLFCSPEYLTILQEPIRAKATIDFNGESEIILNNSVQRSSEFNLSSGVNVVTLKLKRLKNSKAGFKGNILISQTSKVPEQSIALDDSWRIVQENSKNSSPDVFPISLPDGSLWSSDTKNNQLTIRRIIIVNNEKFSPITVTDGLHIARGTAQHVSIAVTSPFEKVLENVTLTFKTPQEIEIIGTSGNDSTKITNSGIGILDTVSCAKSVENGKTFNTYQFHFSKLNPVNKNGQLGSHLLSLVFQLSQKTEAKELNVFYRISGNSENRDMTELWNTISVICLPPLACKIPKKIEAVICHTWTSSYNSQQIQRLLNTWKQAGFNAYFNQTAIHHFRAGKTNDMWLDKPLAEGYYVIVDAGDGVLFDSLVLDDGMKAVDFSGKTHPSFKINPMYLFENRNSAVDCVADFFKWTHANALVFDLEKPPIGFDVSSKTIGQFAKFANLRDIPSKEDLRAKHKEQWLDFQCRTWAQVAEIMRDGVKKADLNGKFIVYSSYQNNYTREYYSIDWKYFNRIIDSAQAGYGRPPSTDRAKTFSALGNIPLTGGVLYFKDSIPSEGYRNLKNEILRRITDGCKGFLFWTWQLLDGNSYHKISEASSILADFEDFFLKNEHCNNFELKGDISRDDVVLLKNENTFLLLLFNESKLKKTANIVFNMDFADLTVKSYPENKIVSNSSRLITAVKPYDVKVFIVEKK